MTFLQSRAIRTKPTLREALAYCYLAVAALAVGLQINAVSQASVPVPADRYAEFEGTIYGRTILDRQPYYLVNLHGRGIILATGVSGMAVGDEVLVRYRRGELWGLIVVRTHYVRHR